MKRRLNLLYSCPALNNQSSQSLTGELETLDERIRVTNESLKALDKKLGEVQKKRKKSQAELESYRLREREIADKIEEDAKELEKMASKQTVLQVGVYSFTFQPLSHHGRKSRLLKTPAMRSRPRCCFMIAVLPNSTGATEGPGRPTQPAQPT